MEKWVKRCVVLRAEAEISAREIEDELKVLYPNWAWVARVLGERRFLVEGEADWKKKVLSEGLITIGEVHLASCSSVTCDPTHFACRGAAWIDLVHVELLNPSVHCVQLGSDHCHCVHLVLASFSLLVALRWALVVVESHVVKQLVPVVYA